LLTLGAVWISLGPPLGIWPLVYDLPGLSFVRVPSRFTVLAVLGLAVLTGFGVQRLGSRLGGWRGPAFAAAIGVLLVAEFAAFPMPVVPNRVVAPAADRWLARLPGPVVVAEVPVPDPANAGAFERRQTEFMLHSTAHWHKTVHGYSGIRPPQHDRLYEQMRTFPDEASLRSLARFGVTHIVVHTELYLPGAWATVEEQIRQHRHQLALRHVAGTGQVYELLTAADR
jgi:hypothetical protein